MQRRFGLVTSLSDHAIDNTTAITSVALGASIIEKHVTLDRNGTDAVKLKTYTADTMTINLNHEDFCIQDGN